MCSEAVQHLNTMRAQAKSFAGREDATQQAHDALAIANACIIVGPPGVGKTALLSHIAMQCIAPPVVSPPEAFKRLQRHPEDGISPVLVVSAFDEIAVVRSHISDRENRHHNGASG